MPVSPGRTSRLGGRPWRHGRPGAGETAAQRGLRDSDCRPERRRSAPAARNGRRGFEANRPDAIFLAAAKVGGILANDTRPAEFLYDNLLIQANVIDAAWRCGVKKLLALGSSCIYPKEAPQPIPEERTPDRAA